MRYTCSVTREADTEREQRIEEFRAAWAAFCEAGDKADAAFLRWFTKRQAGERTNGAQASRLANETSYRSADLSIAAGRLYRLDIDPTTVIPEYRETGG